MRTGFYGDLKLSDKTTWRLIEQADVSPEVDKELSETFPNLEILRHWVIDLYSNQIGRPFISEKATPEELTEFAEWLNFQSESEYFCDSRRRHCLDFLLFSSYGSKVTALAQRNCQICHGLRSEDDQFPKYLFPIRISPVSHQALNPPTKKAFKKAIEEHFARRNHKFECPGFLCLTLTFVLNLNQRDRDLDNMTKAFQDALAQALSFNDRNVHHLNIAKLIFPAAEEYLYCGIAPSFLNSHENVLSPIFHSSWAGQEVIDLNQYIQDDA